ncbi:MAG: hypothetical protein WAU47_05330 [Desulfobaccales bacterium]
MADPYYASNVFINCPFDEDYKDIFRAIVFAVFDCGYIPRCSLELDDATEVRIEKITRIISKCKFGVHDISRTELDSVNKLPRFNMPLELGLFLGAKRYGSRENKSKVCLILDREEYRFQKYISDIAGQDIKPHNNDPFTVISIIRNWLRNSSGRKTIPGGAAISERYQLFTTDLPEVCLELQLEQDNLIFNDYTHIVSEWLKRNP